MDHLIAMLNKAGLRYVVIGGQAVRLKGLPRFTMDWDLYVPNDRERLQQLSAVLEAELDGPLVPMGARGENSIQTYQTRWGIVQFHLGGPGLPRFDEAFERSILHEDEAGVPVRCLSTWDLLASKEAVNRPQDQMDIEFLRIKLDLERGGGEADLNKR